MYLRRIWTGSLLLTVCASSILTTLSTQAVTSPVVYTNLSEDSVELPGEFSPGDEYQVTADSLDGVVYAVAVLQTDSSRFGRYVDGAWELLPSPGIPSNNSVDELIMVSQTEAYLAYRFYDNEGSSREYNLRVKKYNGTSWEQLGTPADITETSYNDNSSTMVIDSTGKLYVEYMDRAAGKITVKTYDSSTDTWVEVGNFSNGPSTNIDIALDSNDMLYLASYGGSKIQLFRYTNDWEYLDEVSAQFHGESREFDMEIDSQDQPVLAYRDGSTRVSTYTGTSWVDFTGADSISSTGDYALDLDPSDVPYVTTYPNQVTTQRYTPQGWERVNTDSIEYNTNTVRHVFMNDQGTMVYPLIGRGNKVRLHTSTPVFDFNVLDGQARVGTIEVALSDNQSPSYAVISTLANDGSQFDIDTQGNLTSNTPLELTNPTDINQDNTYEFEVEITDNATNISRSYGVRVQVISAVNQPPIINPSTYTEWQEWPQLSVNVTQNSSEKGGYNPATPQSTDSGVASTVSENAVDFARNPVNDQVYALVATSSGEESEFTDGGGLLSVYRLDETGWVLVGEPDFSSEFAQFPALAISETGEIFVAYAVAEGRNNNGSFVNPNFLPYYLITVRQLNESTQSWDFVGGQNLGLGNAFVEQLSLQVDRSGQPSVSFVDYGAIRRDFKTLQYKDGTWNLIGIQRGSSFQALESSYQINQLGQHFIGYINPDEELSVLRLDLDAPSNFDNGIFVGGPNFSNYNVASFSLSFDVEGNPYVAFVSDSNDRLLVMRYNGAEWSFVGDPIELEEGSFGEVSLVVDQGNTPYVLYGNRDLTITTDGPRTLSESDLAAFDTASEQLFLQKFDGLNWTPLIDTAQVYTQPVKGISLLLNQTGDPRIGFTQSAAVDTDNPYRVSGLQIDQVTTLETPEETTRVSNLDIVENDSSQEVTLEIIGGVDRDEFTINGTGEVEFVQNTDFENPRDADADNVYELVLRATDNGSPNLSNSSTLLVTVTDIDENTQDDDADGVTSQVENAAPNNGDGNNDGILDSTQSDVVSLPTASGEYLTLAGNNCSLSSVVITNEVDAQVQDPDYDYPQGLVSFTGNCSLLDLEMYLYTSETGILRAANPGYFTVDTATVESVEINSQPVRKFTYQIQDGDSLDTTSSGDNFTGGLIGFGVAVEEGSTPTPVANPPEEPEVVSSGPDTLIRTGGY